MAYNENLKILAFVGLTGSGKSKAVEYFVDKGFPKVYFGGVMYEAMAAAGVPIGEENEKKFRLEIRKKEGDDFVVKKIIQQVHNLADAGQHRIVADGIYTWPEYKAMKHEFPAEVTVVAITAPKHKRYHWLSNREERPQTPAVSSARDEREIEDMQKGGPIAAADFFVLNNGSLEDLYKHLGEIDREINFS